MGSSSNERCDFGCNGTETSKQVLFPSAGCVDGGEASLLLDPSEEHPLLAFFSAVICVLNASGALRYFSQNPQMFVCCVLLELHDFCTRV